MRAMNPEVYVLLSAILVQVITTLTVECLGGIGPRGNTEAIFCSKT